jgi:CRP-like cAMP-binding protein
VDPAPYAAGMLTPISRNRFLARLPDREFSLLEPHLVNVELEKGTWLYRSGEMIEQVYFPHGGIISLTGDGPEITHVEAVAIGREGVIGLMSALNGRLARGGAFVQVGGQAARISAAAFAEAAEQSPAIRGAILRAMDALLCQLQQSVICVASHQIERRLCRWLLHAHGRVGGPIALTQAMLAALLGVQRTTVTLICQKLQLEGLLRVRHGVITLHDATALERHACHCYRVVRNAIEGAA